MRYLKLKLLMSLLLLAGTAVAQPTLYLEPRLGYGSFRMQAMKDFQQAIIRESLADTRAVDSFGPYLQYGLNLTADLSAHTKAGAFFERGSTGGRVAYEDYSGELRFDNLVSYNALGLLINTHKPIGERPFSVLAGIELSWFFSKLQVESYARIYESTESSSDVFNSVGLGVKPYTGLQCLVMQLPVQLTIGYLAGFNGPFHVPGNSKQQLLLNNSNDTLKPDWNGLRLNLAVAVPIRL